MRVVVFLFVGFWGVGFILLGYAGLFLIARLLERRRRRAGQATPPMEPFVPLKPLND